MMESRDIILPSGAVLKVQSAPFAASKGLYKAILREMKAIQIDYNGDSKLELSHYLKDVFCIGFSSDEIESWVWECLKRCLYNGVKIDPKETFEPIEAREDYLKVCVEVIKENVTPFGKSLFAEFKAATASMPASTRTQT